MMLEDRITETIKEKLAELDRPDLFREPHVGFSAADDEMFAKLKELIGPWHFLPSDILPDAKSVISFYVPFTRDVAAEPRGAEHGSAKWGEAY